MQLTPQHIELAIRITDDGGRPNLHRVCSWLASNALAMWTIEDFNEVGQYFLDHGLLSEKLPIVAMSNGSREDFTERLRFSDYYKNESLNERAHAFRIRGPRSGIVRKKKNRMPGPPLTSREKELFATLLRS